MTRPRKRRGTENAQFRQRIPADVRDTVRGLELQLPVGGATVSKHISPKATHIELSLAVPSRDKAEAGMRNAAVSAYLAKLYDKLRSTGSPITLSHEEATMLAGHVYRAWSGGRAAEDVRGRLIAEHGVDLAANVQEGLPNMWRSLEDSALAGQLEVVPLADKLTGPQGVKIDRPSQEILAHANKVALGLAFGKQARNSAGDYSPDTDAARFPAPRAVNTKASQLASSLTPDALFVAWQSNPEQKVRIAQSTVRAYHGVVTAFAQFLAEKRHCKTSEIECSTITKAEVRAFADERLEKGNGVTTVNDRYLAALKSIFGWAAERELLTANPAEGVRLKGEKKGRRAEKVFTDEEAKALLSHATRYKRASANEGRKTAAAKRWVPWLMAYTGTRVGEMAQLRKQDVRRKGERWAIRVTPDAGTVKTKDEWWIPLHHHLIEQGFVEFVNDAKAGHLFLDPNPKGYHPDAPFTRTRDPRGILGPLRALQNRLAEFAREVVTRKTVDPNHGWRHTFKAKGRKPSLGIHPVVLDAIQNHAPRTEGEDYGSGDLFDAMVEAVDKLPRYNVD
ncbi:phage integrase N-terminal SAM-like domain-containing protein [Hyphomicrobium sp. B1]|uniref:tyrosine-type recombinase/integrase n=1 Tax=Hyphomicrobium sp. B1 TaxID=3075651 RepID=UPI003C309B9E